MSKEQQYDYEEPLTPLEATDSNIKQKKIKKIFIFVAPIVIALISAIYFFFIVLKGPTTPDVRQAVQSKSKEVVNIDNNTYLDIDPITIGLTPSGSKREYLRINMALRLSSDEESKIIINKMPMIKDSLITFLRSLRATDFNSSSSSIFLKEELTKRINKITAPITIKEVLFQEITVN